MQGAIWSYLFHLGAIFEVVLLCFYNVLHIMSLQRLSIYPEHLLLRRFEIHSGWAHIFI